MDASFQRIIVLLNQERWKDAESASRMAIENNADAPWNYHFLARALLAQRKYREAESTARRAIALDPDDDNGYCCLARVLCERKHFKEAREAIDRAIELNPGDADNYGILAQLHSERRAWKACLESSLTGLSLDPDNDLCQFYRGIALSRIGDSKGAEAQFLDLLSDDPEDASNHLGQGMAKVAGGQYDAARMHFTEALRLEPNRTDAREGLILCLKARNPFFAFVLKFSLFLERFRTIGMIALLAAFLLGTRAIRSANEALPDLGWLWHTSWILLWTTVILLSTGHALFNLTLSCRKEGRLALSADDQRAARWGWPCLIIGTLSLLNWAASDRLVTPVTAMIFFLMLSAIIELFESQNRWVRKRMAWILVTCAVIPIATPLLFLGSLLLLGKHAVGFIEPMTRILLFAPIVSLLGVSFSENIREWLERRAPDDPD